MAHASFFPLKQFPHVPHLYETPQYTKLPVSYFVIIIDVVVGRMVIAFIPSLKRFSPSDSC